MEAQTLISSLLFLFLFLSLKLLSRKAKRKLNLPPSPATELPVIGHLHLIKPPIHRTFLSLSESAGGAPIFSLRLGNRLVFVVSSRTIAEECFSKNDVALANRPKSIFGEHVGYNQTNMIGASYGEHWRNLRRIGAIEIFSSHRLNSFLSVRKDEIRRLILRLSHGSLHEFKKVELKSMFVNLTFNNIMRMISGKRYFGEDDAVDNEEAKRVRKLMAEMVAGSGAGNAADYFPVLRRVTNYENRVKNLAGRVDVFLQGLIDEKRAANEKGNSLMDHLLCLQESQPEYYTDVIIKGILLALIVAGTDTTAVTLEWALSNLLNHPETLNKARIEIDHKIGSNRLMDEPDIVNLPYLQNIVSETLRLYPAVPMLLPHVASEDCRVAGYDMPRGTTLLVNAWAIHRDPRVWGDGSTSFKPERFERKGEAEKLMPFGLGRRACPGAGLAQRFVALSLGSLIQCFEWERIGDDEIEMGEGEGAIMPKAAPLRAMCKACPIVRKIVDDTA